MSAVQEVSDDGGAAGRPGAGAVDLDESGRHHVVVLQLPKHLLTGLHVVMGHVEDVTWRGGKEAGKREILSAV